MRWPFMTKATHDRIIRHLDLQHEACTDLLRQYIDNEYARATRDGRAQVHAWARDATWNVFHGGQAQAAFQEAERIFAPAKTNIEEVLSDAI